ncbi:MAG: SDR family NAD(P)-dependent oxidoreductase [Pseudomonadota bacterium]|nr:SDR family NAD(P)-dependent oxidoreductase [Pseudomonadota bacterium]
MNKTSWIIGGSSGIGAALALELSKNGESVCISSRSLDSLRQKAIDISNQTGNYIHHVNADVSSYEQVSQAARDIIAKYEKIDRVIFMAGIYEPMKTDCMDPSFTAKIIEINLTGAFNTVNSVLSIMKRQGFGQIAICASLSGYIGLPNAQPYASTKAALINLAETLRIDLKNEIDIKLINPGFVSTRLTDKNSFRMPGLMTPKEAAIIISDGLNSKKFEIHFPRRLSLILKFLSILPYFTSSICLKMLKLK